MCHHLYAYDKQAYESIPVNNVSLARQTLERCISDITSRCASRRLQLNTAKTELIWFGSRQMLEKLTDYDLTLNTGTAVIRPLKSVRDLQVYLDSELTMKTHISKAVTAVTTSFVEFARFAGSSAQQLVLAFILSRLDYCNSLLSRLPVPCKVNHSATAACDECSGSSHHELVVARQCEDLSGAVTLSRLSKELHTNCICSCITSTLDKHHSTCQTVYPQFLHSVADTG